MEIYSPRKFKIEPGVKNEMVQDTTQNTEVKETIRFSKEHKPVNTRSESSSDWFKRVFYEKLRAFFEYDEVC